MVDRNYAGEFPLPVAIVEDTRRALGELARHWRSRLTPVLIAVAGSNGKTTVKEMLASILRTQAGEDGMLATAGNLLIQGTIDKTLAIYRATDGYKLWEMNIDQAPVAGE